MMMSPFEAGMLICFGISWPISIAKSLRTKIVAGKSPLFMAVLCLGYILGMVHKVLYSFDWIVTLYLLNFIMVSIDLVLYFKYFPHTHYLQTERRLRHWLGRSPHL